MGGIDLQTAQEHLNIWLRAELAVSTHQSYQIKDRSLTRANLAEIRKQIQYWEGKVAELTNIKNNKGRNRIYRVVPRDL